MIDVLTCYAVAGISAIFGLSLMWLVQTDQPRVLHALNVFKWAFAALSGLSLVLLVPVTQAPMLLKLTVCFAGMGVTLLAWAFRQLNGRRTPPWVGGASPCWWGRAAGRGHPARCDLRNGHWHHVPDHQHPHGPGPGLAGVPKQPLACHPNSPS